MLTRGGGLIGFDLNTTDPLMRGMLEEHYKGLAKDTVPQSFSSESKLTPKAQQDCAAGLDFTAPQPTDLFIEHKAKPEDPAIAPKYYYSQKSFGG